MKQYVYLVATPESLIASQLPPEQFGNYLAVGTRKRMRGQAIYFEVELEKIPKLPMEYLEKKLVPYEDGEPKHSVFLSIYRVYESVPLDALKSLYLVTDDGKVLELRAAKYKAASADIIHLYQQFNPIESRVASKYGPPEFIRFLTDPEKIVSTPKLFIAELRLNELATDPEAPIHDLPYPNPEHLRECLVRLSSSDKRMTKTVIRQHKRDLAYRTIKDGFFIGQQDDYLYYPLPGMKELEREHYSWWRSALVQCF